MIDETEPGAGEGLLDAAGLGGRANGIDARSANERTASDARSASQEPPGRVETRSVSERTAIETRSVSEEPPSRWNNWRAPRGKPHAPGVWIVYFSLAALPLFGLGQLAIPAAQESRRRYAFCLLAIYVASGLGLLLTTSFLGLRRYLRQRRLPMPIVMAGSWIAVGCALIFLVMGLALLLPRPNAEFAASQVPRFMGSPDQRPLPHAPGDDGVKSDEPGRPTPDEKDKPAGGRNDASHPAGQPSDKPGGGNADKGKSDGGQRDGKKPDGNRQDGGKQENGKKDGGKQEGKQTEDDKTSAPRTSGDNARQQPEGDRSRNERSQAPQDGKEKPKPGTQAEKRQGAAPARPPAENRAPQLPPPSIDVSAVLGWLLPLVQIVFYVVVVGLAAYWAWRRRAAILTAIRDLLAGIRSLWDRLWGRRATQGAAAAAAGGAPPRPRQFADFVDPFATGMALRLPSEQLVRYLFEAFEAWGRDHGFPRATDQTPHEFARSAAQRKPLRHLAAVLADLYCEAAYAPGRLKIADIEPLQELWRELRSRPVAPERQMSP
jgi:hypothetical protein